MPSEMNEPSVQEPATESSAEAPAAADGMLTLGKVQSNSDEPNAEIALRWAEIYRRDHEYRPFWKWLDERSNPERTDREEILESIPLHWAPGQLPPPLRRYYTKKFSGK